MMPSRLETMLINHILKDLAGGCVERPDWRYVWKVTNNKSGNSWKSGTGARRTASWMQFSD